MPVVDKLLFFNMVFNRFMNTFVNVSILLHVIFVLSIFGLIKINPNIIIIKSSVWLILIIMYIFAADNLSLLQKEGC